MKTVGYTVSPETEEQAEERKGENQRARIRMSDEALAAASLSEKVRRVSFRRIGQDPLLRRGFEGARLGFLLECLVSGRQGFVYTGLKFLGYVRQVTEERPSRREEKRGRSK